MKKLITLSLTSLFLVLALGACLDLEVENPNDPDQARALDDPGDVETLIASSWMPYWRRNQSHGWPYHAITSVGGIHQTSVANNAALSLSSLPRPRFDNNPVSEHQGLARWPWFDYYSGLDSANDGLRRIEDGMQIGPGGQNTHRARTFAKFAQGLSLGYLSMLFDQVFVADEFTDMSDPGSLEPVPYQEGIEAAIGYLEEAIALTEQGSFAIPHPWMNSLLNDEGEMRRFSHSLIARFLTYGARTPEERATQVDWDRVIHHVDRGIQADKYLVHQTGEINNPNWKRRIQADFFNGWRADPWFLGTADVSGNFQEWLSQPLEARTRFHVTTPDRRWTAGAEDSDGKYYRYLTTNPFRDERGTWRQAYYQYYRWDGEWTNTDSYVMLVDEMNLIKAEALARTGRTEEAAELVNITRVAHGELPPVTASGVPQSEDCVPRYQDGSCMDLIGAIWYERMLEATGLETTRDYLDQRGFGMLYPGTFYHLPISGRELETLDEPIYSFGGVGGDGAAPDDWGNVPR